jgi:hypothetical protein
MANNFHISEDRQVEGLIRQMESCPDLHHRLQVFLHRDKKADCTSDYAFLMVTPNTFGMVKLLNLNVEYPYVIVDFLDCATEQVRNVQIDVNDNKPQVLFICWQDIKSMIRADKNTIIENSELLEVDY